MYPEKQAYTEGHETINIPFSEQHNKSISIREDIKIDVLMSS